VTLKRLTALALVAALGLAACGDDDDDASSTTAAPAAGGDTTAAASTGEEATLRLWLNGTDTPDEVVNYAIAEFAKLHPDVTVTLERQQWTGLVERLTTALPSSDSPDVVELGNTQAQTFEAAGALVDLTDRAADFGGDDLVQSLLEAGTYDGKLYAVPYYGGARVILYRKDLFEAAGLEIPTTQQELIDTAIALKEANASVPNFSGFYFPGRNWHGALSFIWAAGGDIAVKEGDQWTGLLSTPESIEGLEVVQTLMTEASGAPKDGDDANDYIAFCNGEVGMMPAPGWKVGQIINPDDGCPEMEANIGAFAQPGVTADATAPVFLGGSNLGVSVNSDHPELAADLIAVMTSPGYQEQMAANGLLPARVSMLDSFATDEASTALAAAATNSRFVPTSEQWGGIEAANILPDMLVAIAQGGDVAAEAARADEEITARLNGDA
jgi:N,N'-diacetylchitobiose transport system substrate-binding protein